MDNSKIKNNIERIQTIIRKLKSIRMQSLIRSKDLTKMEELKDKILELINEAGLDIVAININEPNFIYVKGDLTHFQNNKAASKLGSHQDTEI